jgi:hypothetical protein
MGETASDFAASLIGALVGGVLALIGVFIGYWLQRRRDRTEREEALRGFLQALLTELETCWNRASETSNPVIEQLPPGRPLETEMFIKTDFFTVYHNNSHSLGLVRDDELRALIVETVTTYKALVETLNVNTQYYLNWLETKHMEAVAEEKDLKQYYGRKSDYEYDKLQRWAAALKHDYYRLKKQIEKLIPALHKAIGGKTARSA